MIVVRLRAHGELTARQMPHARWGRKSDGGREELGVHTALVHRASEAAARVAIAFAKSFWRHPRYLRRRSRVQTPTASKYTRVRDSGSDARAFVAARLRRRGWQLVTRRHEGAFRLRQTPIPMHRQVPGVLRVGDVGLMFGAWHSANRSGSEPGRVGGAGGAWVVGVGSRMWVGAWRSAVCRMRRELIQKPVARTRGAFARPR
ncbi:hypothetical protein C8R47DRAFT_738901 [Mycena vitilis]|nr:hypothetical protein C8R47DRAFT_738901 [Mycena vitilis]